METLLSSLPAEAKDIKINLPRVLSDTQSGWSEEALYTIAYAVVLASDASEKQQALLALIAHNVDEAQQFAARVAVNSMAMNNVFYRFLHLSQDAELSRMPAGLRMQMMRQHGSDPILFEAMSLAISALSGCGMCIQSHVSALKQNGKEAHAILAIARIASVLNAYLKQV